MGIMGGIPYYWAPTRNQAVAELDSGNLGLLDVKDAQKVIGPSFDYPYRFCPSVIQGCSSREEQIEGQLYQFNDWSPDAKQILYTGWSCWANPVLDSAVALSLWNVEKGKQEQLVSNAGWATWSPDGTQVAFLLFGTPHYDTANRIVSTDFAPEKPVHISVGIMKVATKEVPILIPLASEAIAPEKVEDWGLFRPLWSPDSKRLALHDGQGDLFLAQADGKGVRPVTQGLQVKATWSPNGKWLALWPLGRYGEVSPTPGLERFLPPVGKEETALADEEIIKRYFLRVLTTSPNVDLLGDFFRTYVDFLEAYAQTLEQQGEGETARMYFCRGIEEVISAKPWQGRELGPELEGTYAACRRQGKEETDKTNPEITASPSALPYLKRPSSESGRVHPWSTDGGASKQTSSKRPGGETYTGSQPLPSLYLIEVVENEK